MIGIKEVCALPEGYEIVAGTADIDASVANQLTIRPSDNAVINYNSFSIAPNESVYFYQNSGSSNVLNNVTGSQQSVIAGYLYASGNIFIVNPNGIVFDPSANINVGSLVASTMNIDTTDFLNGDFMFQKLNKDGQIVNQAVINVGEGGFIALLAQTIKNEGMLQADQGTVALASGNKVTLSFENNKLIQVAVDEPVTSNPTGAADAILNTGTIKADSGKIIITASAARDAFTNAVNNEGIILAGKIAENPDGTIALLAPEGDIENSGVMYASGDITVEALKGDIIELASASITTDVGDITISSPTGNITVSGISSGGNLDILAPQGSITQLEGTKLAVLDGDLMVDSPKLTLYDLEARAGHILVGSRVAPIEIAGLPHYIHTAGDIEINTVTSDAGITTLGTTHGDILRYATTGNVSLEAVNGKVTNISDIAVPGDIVKLIGNQIGSIEEPFIVNADTTHIYRNIGDIDIVAVIDLEGDQVTIVGPVEGFGAVTYCSLKSLTLEAQNGGVTDSGQAIIPASTLTLIGNNIGHNSAPVITDADTLRVVRTSEDIVIALSSIVGEGVTVRGPPDGGFAIFYSDDTNLSLEARDGGITILSGVVIYSATSSINLESLNKSPIIINGTISAPEGTVRLWTCGLLDLRQTKAIISKEGGYAYNTEDYVAVSWDYGATTNNWADAANWSGDAVPDTNAYQVTIDYSSATVTTATGYTIGELLIGETNTCSLTLGSTLTLDDGDADLDGDLTIGANGTLATGGYTISIDGDFVNSGVFTNGSGIVDFTKASGTQTVNPGASALYIVNKTGAGTIQFAANTDMYSFNATAGSLDFNAKTITTTAQFIIAPSAAIITDVDAMDGTTLTVGGYARLIGTSGTNLIFRATAGWTFTVTGYTYAEYVNVQYCNATGGTRVDGTVGCTDSGNNTAGGWLFATEARYWVGSATTATANWNTTDSWSTSSGGASGASVPIGGTDVYFDNGGSKVGECVIDTTVVVGSITCASTYTGAAATDGHFDAADNDNGISVSRNITLDNKQVSMGDGTWTVGGSFDNLSVATFNDDSSTLNMTGSSVTITAATANHLYNIIIDGTVSVAAASTYVYADFNTTINGTLTIPSGERFYAMGAYLSNGDVWVNEGGTITGAGRFILANPNSGHGLLTLAGTVSVDEFYFSRGAAGAVLAPGTYDCDNFYFYNDTSDSANYTLSNGAYTFTGNVTITEVASSKSMTFLNNTNGPTISIAGNLIFDMNNTGGYDFTINNLAQAVDITVQGDIEIQKAVGTGDLIWTKGTGTITLSGGSANIDFDGNSVEAVVVNSSGTKTLTNTGITTAGLTVSAGTFDANDQTLSITGNTLIDGGTMNTGTGVITFGDAGGDSVTISSGALNIESDVIATDIVITADTWTNSGGTITYKGSTGTMPAKITSYYDLVINSGAAIFSLSTLSTAVTNNLTVTAGTLKMIDTSEDVTLTVTGTTLIDVGAIFYMYAEDYTLNLIIGNTLTNSGTFTLLISHLGELAITGSGGAKIFTGNNIDFNGQSVSLTSVDYDPDLVLDEAGDKVSLGDSNCSFDGISLGVGGVASYFTAGTRSFIVSGDFSNTATGVFTQSASSIATFNAVGAQTIASGGDSFYSITVADGTDLSIATNDLTVAGNLTIGTGATFDPATYAVTGTGTNVLDVTGTIKVDASTFAGSYVSFETVTLNAGSTVNYSLAGTQTVAAINYSNLTLSGAGTKTLAAGTTGIANIFTTNGLTVDTTTNSTTVNYNGAAQTVAAINYHHLTLSTSGAKTLQTGTTTIGGNLTLSGTVTADTVVGLAISGNLIIGDGATFTAAGYALTVTGTTTIGDGASGNLIVSSATGAKIFTGLVTVNAGGAWNNSGNSTISFRGGITNSNTFTAGSGIQTFETNAQALAGTIAIPSVTVTTITLTNDGTLTVTTALAGTGGLTNGATGELHIDFTGALGISTLTATAVGNTVDYGYAGAQTVVAINYYNLTISGSGTKTLAAAIDIDNDLTITQGTLNGNGKSITIAGDWDNSGTGTYTAGAGTVIFGGTGESIISGSTDFNNLTSTTASKTIKFEDGSTQIVAGVLTLDGGTELTRITLRGETGGVWLLNNTGTNVVSYVDVENSDASGGTEIDATLGSFDAGGNINWLFVPRPTPSGTSPATFVADKSLSDEFDAMKEKDKWRKYLRILRIGAFALIDTTNLTKDDLYDFTITPYLM
ncbi:MAG: filamentous hemagglutinin N-terminal domain-containing protein [Candidatus Omnitrophota bacterium]